MGIQGMQNYPFYFAVAVGQNEVLAGWRKQVTIVGISTLLLLGLFGALLLRLWRMRLREAAMLGTLAQSEAQFRALAEMVPVGICHIDLDGKYTYVNERHLELTGRSRDELLGEKWSSSFHPDDRASIKKSWTKKMASGGAFVKEYRFVRPGGQLTHVLGEVRVETEPDGKARGYIIAQTDITLRKEIEAELLVAKQQAENSNLSKTRFLTAASHDLRQPIQAINLFRDVLGRTDLSEEQRGILNFLSKSVDSLGELLYSLLDISKLDAGQFRPQLNTVSVAELFKVVDSEFSSLALEKGLRFKFHFPLKGLQLMTDSGLLLSVLRNLIGNAFKYTELGGVLVGVRQRGGRVIIQVWDTGIGIDPSLGEQVFDECFQVSNSLRERSKGLGLGLSIARRMGQLLGGEVSYRSRLGSGTVFELSLPLAGAGAGAEAIRSDPPSLARCALPDEAFLSRVRGWQVVVIEDELLVAKSIELSLQKLGISIKVFANAELALACPTLLGADFYLADCTLSGLNGLELLDEIAQRSATPIRAALMTGETLPEYLDLMSSSRWPVLVKPVGLSTLLEAMERALPPVAAE
jgi:PAS domain S-box-containing protein